MASGEALYSTFAWANPVYFSGPGCAGQHFLNSNDAPPAGLATLVCSLTKCALEVPAPGVPSDGVGIWSMLTFVSGNGATCNTLQAPSTLGGLVEMKDFGAAEYLPAPLEFVP